ncbi:nuclear transport factor 2 family protein [Nocardia sp. NPDC050799]|uniref:nuclear transport factor 2 family protein n=1 Tax=Nocardia sp. NPDC050799 TaxID=3154842 RepID=UPI0033EC2445
MTGEPGAPGEPYAMVAQLCGRYAHALDGRRWSELTEVFTPDATMEFAHIGPVTGPEAIGRICAEALAPLTASQHLIGSILVTATGAEPASVCYFHAQHVRDGRQFVVAGTYTDTLRQHGDGWRIAHRVQTVTWTAGDSGVVGM